MLWNPHQFAGVPHLAYHVPGILYPPHLLLSTVLSPARALEAGAPRLVSVVIPAWNEAETMSELLERVRAVIERRAKWAPMQKCSP